MKNLYKSIVLSMALVVPMVSGAATFTNNFALGVFPGSAGLENSTANSGATGNKLLPTSGNGFIDNWNFTVSSANSDGSAQVSLVGASISNISDIAAEILAVSPLGVILNQPAFKLLGTTFGALPLGNYTLKVTGEIGGTPASYSGTLDIKGAVVSAVPVPAAVWLFGSALAGLMGVSGRKKKS